MSTKHLLLVDDSVDILIPMKRFLQSEGYQVDSATNGKEALGYLRAASQVPSLILLDLMMPVMDGIEFRAEQEKDPSINQIPVVLMSASTLMESDALRLGARSFLPKPIDLDVLLSKIEEVLLH